MDTILKIRREVRSLTTQYVGTMETLVDLYAQICSIIVLLCAYEGKCKLDENAVVNQEIYCNGIPCTRESLHSMHMRIYDLFVFINVFVRRLIVIARIVSFEREKKISLKQLLHSLHSMNILNTVYSFLCFRFLYI